MVSRTLGFDGVEFSQHTVEMSEAWCAQHDAATEVFDAILATGLFRGMKRSGLFYAESLRFFKSLVLNGKVEKTLEVARDRLRKGMQVVVAMMGTGEAASARAVKKSREGNGGGDDDDDDEPISVADAGVRDTLLGLLEKAEEHHNEDTQEEWTPRDHQEDVRHLIQPWNPNPEAWLGKYVLLSTMLDRSMLDCFEGAVAQVTKVVNKTFVYVSILPDLARNAGIGEAFTSGRKKVELRLRELRELSALPSNDNLRRSMGFELHVLRRRAVCLTLPPVSPLDALHNGLGGADAVAELTGRSNILKEDAERGGWISVPRDQAPERDLGRRHRVDCCGMVGEHGGQAVSTEALIVTSRAAVLRMRLGLAESCSIVGVRSVPSYHRS